MKIYKTEEIKNIALLGSKGSGKTTLAESLLFESGVIKRRGNIESGNTVSDYFPVEKEYGYSVFSTVFNTEFNGKKLNFVDCPGADDFVGNAYTALGVCDTGVVVVNAEYGVEVGTQNIFRVTGKLNKPVVFALNHMDGEKVDFDNLIEQLREHFGQNVVPVQYPLNAGANFNSMIDVLLMKKYEWGPDGGVPKVSDIPADQLDKATEMHDALLEAAASNDEELMEKFFSDEPLTEDEIRQGLRKGIIDRNLFPVFIVSASKDMGVRRMMEFLGNICPSPAEVPAPETTAGVEVKPASDGPLSLFVFKTSVEPHIGEVSYFKVMSGTLKAGDDLENVTRGGKERLAQIFTVSGQLRNPADQLNAGDIGAAVKLKDVRTGNSLDAKGCDYQFDFIKYPAPRYIRAIKPASESDAEKLMSILTRMHEEDPTILVEQSKELKQTLVKGQGEFHLRTLKWRVENNDKLPIEFFEPKIPYRETITKAARADYRHKKQSGGSGQFGEVHLIIEPYSEGMPEPDSYKFGSQEYKLNVRDKQEIPLDWGGKLIVYNCIVGGAIDARFIPAIVKGLMDRMEQGPLTGSYARDVRVMIYDGKMHPVDSNEISFRLAGRNAFSQAFKAANPKILEPVYDVEVITPADTMGDVMKDVNGRRGIIMDQDSEGGIPKLTAKVPLKEMSSYATSLSSITGGRGSFSMQFSSYELVPGDVQDKLLKEYAETQEED
ncbi:MAG: elongation factor G [Muribaculaceae bacterium]|nr:elongation factor G [Muribaculaceae bacterium]